MDEGGRGGGEGGGRRGKVAFWAGYQESVRQPDRLGTPNNNIIIKTSSSSSSLFSHHARSLSHSLHQLRSLLRALHARYRSYYHLSSVPAFLRITHYDRPSRITMHIPHYLLLRDTSSVKDTCLSNQTYNARENKCEDRVSLYP